MPNDHVLTEAVRVDDVLYDEARGTARKSYTMLRVGLLPRTHLEKLLLKASALEKVACWSVIAAHMGFITALKFR